MYAVQPDNQPGIPAQTETNPLTSNIQLDVVVMTTVIDSEMESAPRISLWLDESPNEVLPFAVEDEEHEDVASMFDAPTFVVPVDQTTQDDRSRTQERTTTDSEVDLLLGGIAIR